MTAQQFKQRVLRELDEVIKFLGSGMNDWVKGQTMGVVEAMRIVRDIKIPTKKSGGKK